MSDKEKQLSDYTIAEAHQQIELGEALAKVMGLSAKESAEAPVSVASQIYSNLIGKYVLVRSRNEGINAGTVSQADKTGIVLSNARRIHYHRPADKTSWYEGVANSGLREDSRISAEVTEKTIIEEYSATICTSVAEQSIKAFHSHEQTGND